jgi:hypothetical protein
MKMSKKYLFLILFITIILFIIKIILNFRDFYEIFVNALDSVD